MKRRDFLTAAAGATLAWPGLVHAQQSAVPIVGFLRSTSAEPFTKLLTAFRQGLLDSGFTDGKNVVIEQRYAENHYDRLPDLARDLVRRNVAAIATNSISVPAVQSVAGTVPIVFVSGDDPIKTGLVTNLNHPGGNVTGVTFFGGGQLNAKRVELLHELIPGTTPLAALLDSSYPASEVGLAEVMAAGHALGRTIEIVKVTGEREYGPAFARIAERHAGALLVSGSPFFTSRRRELVALAERYGIPAIYDQRNFVESGGLISYGASFTGAYRHAGLYVARILKGARPGDLPVEQPTTFELILNLKTAKALGLAVPQSILARADEVIE